MTRFRDKSEAHAATVRRLCDELAAKAGPPFEAKLFPGLAGLCVRFSRGYVRTSPGDLSETDVFMVAQTSVPDLARRWWAYVDEQRVRMAAQEGSKEHGRAKPKRIGSQRRDRVGDADPQAGLFGGIDAGIDR